MNTPAKIFFVIQRGNGQWTVGSRIISVHAVETDAEAEAMALKKKQSHLTYGVAMLKSEVRAVAEPYETVRHFPTDDA